MALKEPKSLLVIWNDLNQTYALANKTEKQQFIKKEILQPMDDDFFKKGIDRIDVIDTPDRLLDREGGLNGELNFSAYKGIIILAELIWQGVSYYSFSGFDIIQKLRLKRVSCPMFVFSFLSKEKLKKSSKFEARILSAPCHKFVPLPVSEKPAFTKFDFYSLTDHLLDEIVLYLLNPRESVNNVFHDLYNERDKLKPNLEKHLQKLDAIFQNQYPKELEKVKESIISEFLLSSQPSPFLDERKNNLLQLIADDLAHDDISLGGDQLNWKVLFIDDQEEQRRKLKNLFRDSIADIEVIEAISGTDAFEKLKLDGKGKLEEGKSFLPANSITVVICDLRLENDAGDWDYYQGYDIIREIAFKMKNLVSFFVLTSKRGAILNNQKRNSEIRIIWNSKQDIFNESKSGFNIFLQRILEEGQFNSNSIFNRNISAGYWQNNITKNGLPYNKFPHAPKRDYYRYFRTVEPGYYNINQEISQNADDFITEALKTEKDKSYFIERFEKIDFCRKIPTPPGTDSGMKAFYDLLLGRRIALGLAKIYGWTPNNISSILKNKNLYEREADRSLLNTYLSLETISRGEVQRLDTSQNKLLLEEINWLESHEARLK